jgi:hypothetical protein
MKPALTVTANAVSLVFVIPQVKPSGRLAPDGSVQVRAAVLVKGIRPFSSVSWTA